MTTGSMPNSKVTSLLCQDWRTSGIGLGDHVLLHSSVKSTIEKYFEKGYDVSLLDILTSFREVVGSKGTLLLPLFNFDFSSGSTFDIRNTPSQMGKLTEFARHQLGCVRTGHPIYSFAVFGEKAEICRQVDNFSGYGADSPFGLLRQWGGKIACLGVPHTRCMTYYHHVEEMCGVPYRYHKTFEGQYISSTGVQSVRKYGLFVRNIEFGVATSVGGIEGLLWQKGLCRGSRWNEGTCLSVISASDLFDATQDVIKSGKAEGLLYRIEKS